jgi:hypothetical protein
MPQALRIVSPPLVKALGWSLVFVNLSHTVGEPRQAAITVSRLCRQPGVTNPTALSGCYRLGTGPPCHRRPGGVTAGHGSRKSTEGENRVSQWGAVHGPQKSRMEETPRVRRLRQQTSSQTPHGYQQLDHPIRPGASNSRPVVPSLRDDTAVLAYERVIRRSVQCC